MDEGSTRQSSVADPHRGFGAAGYAALAAVAIPLVCGALLVYVTGLRLEETDRRLDKGLARVASAWLADRVALATEGARLGLLARAGERLDARVGLFDTEGRPVAGTALAELPPAQMQRALAGDLDTAVIGGEHYDIGSTALRPPLGRLNVVVAIPRRATEESAAWALVRLSALALALALFSALFGLGFGSDFGASIDRLRSWIREQVGRPLGDAPAALPASAGIGEVARAAERLRERLAEESAAYRTAHSEIASLDGERTGLLAAVSSELHRPLERVVGVADGLLAGDEGELLKSQQEDVRIIRNAGERLLKLVEEVVDLSALVGGDLEFDEAAVSLVELAREVVETARGQVRKKQLTVTLEQEDPADVIAVRGNRQRLWQVVTNLVSNAIKFTEQGGVTVRLGREADGAARLEVEDSGVGISPMDQKSIFESFRQLCGRGGRKAGTGLGLAICRRLIELHGGKIRVSSMLARGTKLTVILPGAP